MHEKSIELLNKAVGDELSAVHQYMYWHFHCDDQGFDLLAQLFKRTAVEEMIHVEKLAEQVREVEISLGSKQTFQAKAEAEISRAELLAAEERVITAQEQEAAERRKAIELTEAAREAEARRQARSTGARSPMGQL